MEAIKKLIYKNKKEYKNKYILYFDLPIGQTLELMQNEFSNWRNFKYLDLSKTTKANGYVKLHIDKKNCRKPGNLEKLIYDNFIKQKDDFVNPEGQIIEINSQENEFTILDSTKYNEFNTQLINGIEDFHGIGDTINGSKCSISMIKVGHGLSIIDEKQKIIYDAGGSAIHYKQWVNKVNHIFGASINVIFILSHPHLDHYGFLYKALKNGALTFKIERFITNKSDFASIPNKLKSLLDSKGIKISVIGANKKVRAWSLYIDKSTEKIRNINSMSIIAQTNCLLLTGDSNYEKVEKIVRDNSLIFKNIQIPHHGSLAKHDTGEPWWNPKKYNGYWSFGTRYNLHKNERKLRNIYVSITKP